MAVVNSTRWLAAGAPGNDFRQEGFPHAGIADDDGAGSFGQEVQIQQAEDAVLQLHAALVVLEVEAVDGVLGVQPREAKTALDGTAVARLQFQVRQGLQGLRETEVLGGGLRDHLIQLAAHRRQAELIQFLVQRGHGTPFGNEG
jgi:hypothetical protein